MSNVEGGAEGIFDFDIPCSIFDIRCLGNFYCTVNRTVVNTLPSGPTTSTLQAPVHSGTMFLLLQVRQFDPRTEIGTRALSSSP